MKILTIIISLFVGICHAHIKGDIEHGDFNFDGNEDYRVFNWVNGRKYEWNHFLFDPDSREYIPSAELDALWNPTFNLNNKTISTYANGGHAGHLFTRGTYIWKNGEVILSEQVLQRWNRQKELYVKVTLQRINGEMKLSDIELLAADEIFECQQTSGRHVDFSR